MSATRAETIAALNGGIVDLSSHVRMELTGTDRVRYLNGQVTNDVRRASAAEVMRACITDHKGGLQAMVAITVHRESLRVSADAGVRESLPRRLEKYIIADDVRLEDVTERTWLYHFFGNAVPAVEAANHDRFGVAGHDVWTDHPLETATEAAAQAAEVLRIQYAIPAWGHELTEGILPPEARLEAAAIDYYKGCYIGQEVISRMKTAGKVNRLMGKLRVTSGPPVQPGWALWAEEAEAGVITSAVVHPVSGQCIALGFVKRSGGRGPWRCGTGVAAAESVVAPVA